mmetsp:Transcript_33604/g.68213  ORF Transcript_33604/g.68213 Transcript_33604/m.68213 type:complete len:139 (-) Transcript_33604:422-838(-)
MSVYTVDGKEVPIFFAAGTSASMTSTILRNMFAKMDELGITKRGVDENGNNGSPSNNASKPVSSRVVCQDCVILLPSLQKSPPYIMIIPPPPAPPHHHHSFSNTLLLPFKYESSIPPFPSLHIVVSVGITTPSNAERH